MTLFDSKDFLRAKQLVIEGKFDDALQLMSNFEKREEMDFYDLVSWHLLKCNILYQQDSHKELKDLAEQTYEESLRLGKSLFSVDALYYWVWSLIWLHNLEKADELIAQGEELLKTFTQEPLAEYKQREASIAFLKGYLYDSRFTERRDPNLALEHFEKSLELREKYGAKYEIVESLLAIAGILWFHKGEVVHAFKYLERALILAKEGKMKFNIAFSLLQEATYFGFKGEFDRSIKLHKQSLELFKELNNKSLIANTLNNLASTYRSKGDLERALECIEQCIALRHEFGNAFTPATSHANLIHILIEKGDLKRAQEFLNQLEQKNIELKNKLNNLYILKSKASILKTSSRIIDKGKAQEILKQILEDEDSPYELNIVSLLDLCELLLFELNATNEPQILDEFQGYLSQLINIVKKGRSYWVLAETYLLQARLSLFTLNINKARRNFAKSQNLAEKYGLIRLAMRISNEHDELLKKVDMWENLKKSELSLAERMELSRLNEQIGLMVRKRVIEGPELSDEESILLLIVSEGGTPIFSQFFIKDRSFKDYLFGGFLSAINSFMNEMFSEELDRASFGEYTLLMNSISPFMIFYLYKGQSYSAHHRLKLFINELKGNIDVWKKIEKYYQTNQEIQMNDVPSLDSLINDIFIEKTITLDLKL